MKHAHTLKRAMAVMLALVLTLSLVTPTWAMSSSSVATKGENNGITWEKGGQHQVAHQGKRGC